MKYILLFLIIISINSVNAQVDSKGKILDNSFDCKEVASSLKNEINYEKFGSDGFIRFEGNKVQLFDSQLEKKWEHQLEMLDGVGRINWMTSQNDGENVYIIQYSTAVKVKNIKSRLIKITKAGELTQIDLNEIVKFRGVGAIEILDNEIFVNFLEVKAIVINGFSNLKYFSHNLEFTPELKQIGKISTLPAFSVDEKFNYIWRYSGKQDNNYTFVSSYFIDNKGNCVDKDMGSGVQTRTLTINTKGEILEDSIMNTTIPEVFDWAKTIATIPKYDTSKYKFEVSGCNIKNKISPTIRSSYSNITIRSGDSKSKNLIIEVFSMINPKILTKKSRPKMKLIEVLDDKQNGGLQVLLFIEDLYRYYLLSIDENLDVLHISEFFSQGGSDDFRITDKDFYLYADGVYKSYGSHPNDYIKTPIDFALSQKGLSFNTVLEFDNYQLLFIDNKKKKTTTAYRFEK